uniref:Uncharacterized protein n=1 Tax=Meloidogyne enterolobii TaxID=390850 RepID=A0A6V7TWS2_MELEN|nr:unnamed protein product [Meloidogyne enterolobii]
MGHTLSSYPSKNDFTVHSFLLKIFLNDSTYRPCPQPFHFATSSPQRLPKFDLKFSETCIFSINSTEAIKLTINRDNKTSFGIKVLETGNFPDPYAKDKEGQLAKVEACKCFPSNLMVSRDQPLNLLSQGFPSGYCGNLNCFTEISLENSLNTRDEESLQIQFNTFQTDFNLEPLSLQIPFGEEKGELISFESVLSMLKFLTVDSPKIFLNFTTKAVQHDTGFNLTIKRIKRNKVQFTFDGVKCPFMECYWEIQPPKDSKIYHYIIVKLNLSHPDDGDFVEECDTNFREGSRGCSRTLVKILKFLVKNEILVNDVSRFVLKRDAFVRVWYHRESGEMINNPNIPRQFNLAYEWREEPHPLLPKKRFNVI